MKISTSRSPISALQKISGAGIPLQHQNQAIAHLYISNPVPVNAKNAFGVGSKKFSNLFSTHPPVEERIKAITGYK